MAHFAKLDDNNKVIAVHVVNNDVITVDGAESEQTGIDFLTQLHGHANWVQTSYSGSFRKNYAGLEYTYDRTADAFYPPKPFESWVLNTETAQWDAPIPAPQEDGKVYIWSEADQTWIEKPLIEVKPKALAGE
jgi:hypothetical protein